VSRHARAKMVVACVVHGRMFVEHVYAKGEQDTEDGRKLRNT
jgi:hypothetical protein